MLLRPMLAEDADLGHLMFPYLSSFKLDGFRGFNQDGCLYTRSGKPFPNVYTRKLFGQSMLNGLDGELIIGQPNSPQAFDNTSGPMRRIKGEPEAAWYVFDDRTSPTDSFMERSFRLASRVAELRERYDMALKIHVLQQRLITCEEELQAAEAEALMEGYEGLIIRSPIAPYKFGRSTVKENYMLKVKRFETDEGVITELEEQMINDNVAFTDELGKQKRSQHRENMRGSGMVGAFWMRNEKWAKPFKVSATRMSLPQRRAAWQNPHEFLNKIGRFTYFPHGSKDAPRHGQFDGIRPEFDL